MTNYPNSAETWDLHWKKQRNRNQKKNNDSNSKGIIDLENRPTICHMCGKLLVNTYIERDDINQALGCYVICSSCIKALPLSLQNHLKRTDILNNG